MGNPFGHADIYGQTALHWAAEFSKPKDVNFLYSNMAEKDICKTTEPDGCTILQVQKR